MQIVSGLFDSHDDAARAVDALEAAGIARAEISVIGPAGYDASNTAASAGAGAAVGAGAGLLAGLGAFAIPGIGPVVGAGWLASTVIGAAAGGAAGGLLGAFADVAAGEREDHLPPEGVTLVTAHVDETQIDGARAILAGSIETTPSLIEAA